MGAFSSKHQTEGPSASASAAESSAVPSVRGRRRRPATGGVSASSPEGRADAVGKRRVSVVVKAKAVVPPSVVRASGLGRRSGAKAVVASASSEEQPLTTLAAPPTLPPKKPQKKAALVKAKKTPLQKRDAASAAPQTEVQPAVPAPSRETAAKRKPRAAAVKQESNGVSRETVEKSRVSSKRKELASAARPAAATDKREGAFVRPLRRSAKQRRLSVGGKS